MNLERIVEPLLQWYDENKRILPWREKPEAYRVWVSEIMLQQTRVEAVKPYYQRFMEALPNVESLALVSEDELLKLWEGLGYYNRARNLQKAARMIMEDYNGQIPCRFEELVKLPGIGSYTAGAVASIAFGEKVPAVDGNVLRIIARVRADESDILDAKVKKKVEDDMAKIMPASRPDAFNQALMELGAIVCVPNGQPKCGICPWFSLCEARKQELTDVLPQKKTKKARTIEEKTVLVIQDENRAALRKRPDGGLLAGMYEFPSIDNHADMDEVVAYVKKLGYNSIQVQSLGASRHIFTHKEWHMIGYSVRVDELEPRNETEADEGLIFVEPVETQEKYPIPSAFRAYTKYLNIKQGNAVFQGSAPS